MAGCSLRVSKLVRGCLWLIVLVSALGGPGALLIGEIGESLLPVSRVQGGHNIVDGRLLGLAHVLAVLAVGGCDFVGQS